MDAKLVNDIFKNGIRALMGGFNPWGFGTWLKSVKNVPFFKYMVPLTEIPLLEQFAVNVEKMAEKFFQWDQTLYNDPCDQCFDMPSRKQEILDTAFEGMNVCPETLRDSLFLFNLFMSFKQDLDFMLRNIESWCMAHKFVEGLNE